MKVHIRDGDIHELDARTRLPFRYGIVTMTSAPQLFLRLRVEVDGKPAAGIAADGLPPKWFTKDPKRPIDEETEEMRRVIASALRLAAGLRADSPFDAWRQLAEAQSAWGEKEELPPLLTQFGTSLVERALIEAVCRAVGRPFHQLLRANTFGIRPGDIYFELAGRHPAEFLPEQPLQRITVRHTVGLLDPLTDGDIPSAQRLDDGLPQSLAACIDAYGLRHFKIKVSGDLERDRPRLDRIAKVLAAHAPADYAFSLDGNEQFESLAAFGAYWITLCIQPELKEFLDHLLFVEQPVHRAGTLPLEVPVRVPPPHDWPRRPPILIDESDAQPTSLWLALGAGYAGTSHKNCKGVFKSVVNRCLLEKLRREEPERQLLQSGEDLATIGPVALLQDLAVCAALGIESVERNGHHYFAGLSMFPEAVQRQVLECHGDLYRPSPAGWPTLDVRGGAVAVASVKEAPFGVGFAVDVERFAASPI